MLVGPTAAGKTALSLRLAEGRFEIISADSVQVYRYLDIGSGKPGRLERAGIRHHCIDIVDPDFNFTAGEFSRCAHTAAEDIVNRGLIPLFVGGTGLYVDSYFKGLSEIPPVDQSIKDGLLHELEREGPRVLYERLVRCDPAFAARIHPNDRQRILRGLEVYRQFNRPLSGFFDRKEPRESQETLYIGLRLDRGELGDRIGRRVDAMIDRGFVDEVRGLRGMGFGPELRSMQTIGYAEINGFLDGKLAANEVAETIKTNTRHYAKRQMTWFGKNGRIKWFSPDQDLEIREAVERWLDSVA